MGDLTLILTSTVETDIDIPLALLVTAAVAAMVTAEGKVVEGGVEAALMRGDLYCSWCL